MSYVVGFVAAVPEANKDAYRAHVQDAVAPFKRLGTGRMVEAWGDDVPKGEQTDFYRAVDAREDEAIVYAVYEYADRQTADAADAAMANDLDMEAMMADMPFDATRMIFGGFEVLFDKRRSGETSYIDGSILAVPSEKRDAYVETYSALSDAIFEEGAVRVTDAWGVNVPDGKVTDYRRAVKALPDEVVVLSWVEWPDKATRDAAWEKLYRDPRFQSAGGLFDEGRRVWGGFVPILDR